MGLIALDTEATGLDFHHGTKPYMVTTCDSRGKLKAYYWPVDPLTREPQIDQSELELVRKAVFDSDDEIVMHNAKYDVMALQSVLPPFEWPWHRTHDSQSAAHLLSSNQRKNLTDLAVVYLGKNILPEEKAIHEATEDCRRKARSHLPDWKLAAKGAENMPSASKEVWKADMWLPEALCRWARNERLKLEERGDQQEQLWLFPEAAPVVRGRKKKVLPPWWWDYSRDDHPYYTLLKNYAKKDAEITYMLWMVMRKEIGSRDLWTHYNHSMRIVPLAYKMENDGLCLHGDTLSTLISEYSEDRDDSEKVCLNIAKEFDYDLVLPKAGRNASLDTFCFDVLKLPPIVTKSKKRKTDKPSLDADTLAHYQTILEKGSKEITFIKHLAKKRKGDKAIEAMESYQTYMLPTRFPGWFRMHPHCNPTGTDTLRWSFSNPNSANISKREGYNLRAAIGPMPGQIMYSADGQNLELRIAAFAAGEKDAIEVFNNPKQGPYYGSYHLVVFDLLYPELFKKYGKEVKILFESTYYQWIKNGNFAIIYGAQRDTADRTFRVAGAFDLIRNRFPRIAALSDKWFKFADKNGRIFTMPSKFCDPAKGYPLTTGRSKYDRVSPTYPFNYFVSGTACFWMRDCMIKCQEKLDVWNKEGYDAYITAQVHDELVFIMPRDSMGFSKDRVLILKALMESCGDDIGVPTPVAVEQHDVSWAVGLAI